MTGQGQAPGLPMQAVRICMSAPAPCPFEPEGADAGGGADRREQTQATRS